MKICLVRGVVSAMRLSPLVLFASLLAPQLSAVAGTYEALCGTSECTIVLSAESITTPYGIIPTTRVANWGGTGSSSQDLVLGAAATYVLGPVGLVGFLAKTHDYNYLITGYDQLGNRTSVQIKFQNSVPAKKFVQEMVEVTGLGMGQTRTASDIKALEKRVAVEGIGAIRRPGLSLDEEYAKERGVSLSPSQSSSRSKCWSSYLAENPSISKWAEANPVQSQSLRLKYDDC